jgi:hypothetical protein
MFIWSPSVAPRHFEACYSKSGDREEQIAGCWHWHWAISGAMKVPRTQHIGFTIKHLIQ